MGEPHGKGILEYKDGNTYYGHFDKGIQEGLGFWEYSENDASSRRYFAGNFQKNKFNGNGSLVWRDGLYYGEFNDDSIAGKGLRMWASGVITRGLFINGVQSGYGIAYYTDGAKYEGNFEKNRRQGRGTITYALNATSNALSYEGNFENDEKSGYGTLIWKGGDKYVGEFKYELRNGYGTYYYPSGDRYEGNWENNDRNGFGKFFSADGSLEFEGNWKDNQKQPN